VNINEKQIESSEGLGIHASVKWCVSPSSVESAFHTIHSWNVLAMNDLRSRLIFVSRAKFSAHL
jgi:hypothetical protein